MATMFEGMGAAGYEAEAEALWGDTDAYAESARRTRGYGEAEWRAVLAEQAAIYDGFAAALAAGAAPSSEEARALVARHRCAIDRAFYPCSAAMQRKLADLYEGDARFAASLDRHGEGVAAFVIAAIRAASPP